jgi:hypothetical protein
MSRTLKIAAALFVGLVPGWSSDQTTKEPAKPPVKNPPAVVKPAVPGAKVANPKKGVGVGVAKKGVQLRQIPNAQIQRFLRMSPQERDIAIDKLPIPQQENLRKMLERFDAQPPEERERQLKLFELLSKLPKEQQDLINQRIREMNQLAPDRRGPIQRAYWMLSDQSEDERRTTMNDPAFKERFTPMEQQIITDLVKYYPNPKM